MIGADGKGCPGGVAGQEPAQRVGGTVGTAIGGMTVVPPGTFAVLSG